MINCPYCGEEIPEDNTFCQRCRSMLITSEDADESEIKKSVLSKAANPWSAAAVIILLSAVLFFFFRSPAPSSADLDALSAKDVKTSGKDIKDAGDNKAVKTGEEDRDERAALYAEVVEYENKVNSLFGRAEKLVSDSESLESLGAGEGETESAKQKFEELRPILAELKNLSPPPGLERCQSALVTSMSKLQDALRSEAMYLQSRNKNQLDRTRSQLEASRQQKENAVKMIEMVKSKNAPPEPVPEEAAPQVEPSVAPDVEPAETVGKEVREGEEDTQVVEPETEDGATEGLEEEGYEGEEEFEGSGEEDGLEEELPEGESETLPPAYEEGYEEGAPEEYYEDQEGDVYPEEGASVQFEEGY